MKLFDDMPPELQRILDHAETEMLPKMKGSALCISITAPEPDIKLCLEVGAAILYDKPLILLVPEEMQISANLKRVASRIIYGSAKNTKVANQLKEAIKNIIEQDRRVKEVRDANTENRKG
jgi:hypothetical protein